MLTGEYPPAMGGVGDYTAHLCDAIAGMGGEVAIVTGRAPGVSGSTAMAGSDRVLARVEHWGFGCWRSMALAAARFRADVLHIQYQAAAYDMRPAIHLLPAYLRVRLPGLPIVTTFHDLRIPYLFPKAGPLRPAAIRLLDRLSQRTVVTNQADLDDLGGPGRAGRGDPPRRWLIPLASAIPCDPPARFDRGVERRRLGAGENTLLLSYFGFMNDSKGVEHLLDTLVSLLDRGHDARLLIVGGEAGSTDESNVAFARRIDAVIAGAGLQAKVTRSGFLPPGEVSASLLASDICVLPFRDGASLRRSSMLAAMAHSLPVVTTLAERPDPLLLNGENVVMVQRDSPAAMAAAVERLWRDDALLQRVSAGARFLASRFEWANVAGQHMELYRDLARARDTKGEIPHGDSITPAGQAGPGSGRRAGP
jgi:polysaccharide biosynthesis protein PslF